MIVMSLPDKGKADSLIEMAKITFKRLKETNIFNYPSNTLNDYYDIIHKIMEALTSIEGVKVKGDGAHQELIDYICKKHNYPESIRLFLQEIRDFRNRIAYEGFMVNENYIRENFKKIEDIIQSLFKNINPQLIR